MTDKTAYEQIIERRARAIAWTMLTDKGRAECKWPDDFGEDECNKFRIEAIATFEADEAEGLALVPERVTSEMVRAYRLATKDGCLIGLSLDAAIAAGRIRRTE